VPLIMAESQSATLATLVAEDKEATIWWGTPLECHSALHRRHRERPLVHADMTAAIERIRMIVEHADTVSPSDELRRRAARLLAVHPLRAADALQLAAALLWCEEQPHAEGFVSLDGKLRDAAQKEGFSVLPTP
jgi:predicted nucleic acid-binding protein